MRLLPTREEVAGQLDTLIAQGKVHNLSLSTHSTAVEVAQFALTSIVTEAEEANVLGVGSDKQLMVNRTARLAVETFLSLYEPWLDPDDPEGYLEFVSDPEFVPAVVAVGCLAAGVHERYHLEQEGVKSGIVSLPV
jgi:hypothetical protein